MIEEITIDRWQQYVESHPESTVFHHKNWIELLQEQYGYDLKIVALFKNNTIIVGIPFLRTSTFTGKKRLVSLPFTDYLEPLSNSDSNISLLLSYIKKEYNSSFHQIEIRFNLDEISNEFRYDGFVRHILSLSSNYKDVFSTFKMTQVQQCINKAMNDGVTIGLNTDLNSLSEFYRMHLKVRKYHGTPIQPKSFFYKLKKKIFDKNLGFIIVAYLAKIPIAASIFMYYKNTIIYKYSASDYNYLSYRPNNLILWSAIKWGCENGLKYFDFGISKKEDKGLITFKSGWGTKEINTFYFYLSKKGSVPKMKIGNNIYMKKLIQKSPLFICRLIGELFYKYAG